MKRQDLVLAAMAPANGGLFRPVQAQKLFFLIDENIAEDVGGPHFNFEPYHYGPFDKDVYGEIENLAAAGLAESVADRTWNSYRLTTKGQQTGEHLLAALPEETKKYVQKVAGFVRALSFTQLVSSVYRAYPRMRENSVFQG